MIIDFHTHIFPPKIVEKALNFLSEKSKIKPFTNGTLEELLISMEKSGISISVNMPVATHPQQTISINEWCKSIQSEKIISFASYHPALKNPKLICEIRKKSFLGIKLHPEFQNFSPDDKSLEDVWKACIDNELIVFFHAGADFAFNPPFKSNPAKFAKLHEKFPELKIVLAHFGSWKMWNELERTLLKSNIFLETSFTLGFIEEQYFVELSRKHGIGKIIFGTDSPWRSQADEIKKISSIPFSKQELNAILYQNAKHLLKIK
ncbi:MAG TPA: amidohydrolase family protein [Victivallales bacterium]|nr:amidohydrolase family protein [Victivallales bacterium]HRR05770.1 amidohydrolase family protein [Victivallales bacterium]HRR29486.1 amidohydrolase family protein [Victivallales bacterium]